MTDRFEGQIVAGAIVSRGNEILVGRKEDVEDHPISGEWHFIGGHIDWGEEPEEAVKREIKEETGLEVEVDNLIDCWMLPNDKLRVLYHCRALSKDARPMDDLQEIKWVESGKLLEFLEGNRERSNIEERPLVKNFVQELPN